MTKENEIEVIEAIWKLYRTQLLECPFEVPPVQVQEIIERLSAEQLRGVMLDAAIKLEKLKRGGG